MDEIGEHGNKTDKCISDLINKSAVGFFAGAVFSILFCKRRSWPMFLGLGVGSGSGASDCLHIYRQGAEEAAEAVGLGCDLPEMFKKTQAAMEKK